MRQMKLFSILSLLIIQLFLPAALHGEKCTTCHKEELRFSPFHSPDIISCEQCHGGNPDGLHKEVAHLGMEAYPGRMQTVAKSCGQARCHTDLIPLVENSIMNTLDGMISVTRQVFGDDDPPHENQTVSQRLTESGVDSYLRKLCVSCHLGSDRKNHGQSFKDRGGGCSACHLQTYPEKKEAIPLMENDDETGHNKVHPILTIQISNDRCFGCHSRSGRISLNYLGLAEVETFDKSRIDDFGRLYDKRLVEKKKADVHHLSGMACIDCHTVSGIMGSGKRVNYLREQTDITCDDCHARQLPTKSFNELSPRERKYAALYANRLELDLPEKIFVTRKQKSPLYHIRDRGKERVMQSKLTGRELVIPLFEDKYYHTISGHERLTCDSCHTEWAPQCYGCHIEYDPDGSQGDHLEKRKTAGRWIETRWNVKSESPALGISDYDKITTFIPGMNLIVPKTEKTNAFVKQIFAATSAHTTQKNSRSCVDCHQSDHALGIINQWSSHPENTHWRTPTGWISSDSKQPGIGTKPGDRSFNREEIKRIKESGRCLKCHQQDSKIFQSYNASLKKMTPSCFGPQVADRP